MTLQTLIDYGATAISWTVTLIRLKAVVRSHWDPRVVKPWLFALFLSLFVTFQIDAVYLSVDRFSGVPNLAWMCSYLFLVLATHMISHTFCNQTPRWIVASLPVAIVLLLVTFILGPSRAPETLDHVIPTNPGEVLFMGVAYGYSILMLVYLPVRSCAQGLRQGHSQIHAQARTLMILLALVIAALNLANKFTAYLFSASFSPILTETSRWLGAALTVVWPLSMASNEFYRHALRPVQFLHKLYTYRQLHALQDRLERVCSLPFRNDVTWLDLIRDVDLYIYRRVIGILDSRKLLARWIQENQGNPQTPIPLAEARLISRGLQRIPKSADFEHVVYACQNIHRRIVRRTW